VDNDRVYVDLDQRLSAPPRLTAPEAAALSAAAELLRPAAGDALASALQKLERVLPPAARSRAKEMGRKIDAALDAPESLPALTRAILERREVTFDYASPGHSPERRQVRPFELLSHRGVVKEGPVGAVQVLDEVARALARDAAVAAAHPGVSQHHVAGVAAAEEHLVLLEAQLAPGVLPLGDGQLEAHGGLRF